MTECYTFTLCVHSAELDSAVQGSYCKIYLDHHEMSNGSSLMNANYDLLFGSGRRSRANSVGSSLSNAYHTTVETSQKKTKQPIWGETFCLAVLDRRSEILTIRLKSKKLLHLSVTGACVIPLRQIATGRMIDQWFPLLKGGKRRGMLRVQLTLTPRTVIPGRYSLGSTMSGLVPVSTPLLLHPHEQAPRQPSSNQQLSPPSSASSQPQHFGPKEEEQPKHMGTRQSRQSVRSSPYLGQQPLYYDPSHKRPKEIELETTQPTLQTNESSEDDDEAYLPRVAEFHRFESELIGPSSDEGDNQLMEEVREENQLPQQDWSPHTKPLMDVWNSHASSSSSEEEVMKAVEEGRPDRSSWISSGDESDSSLTSPHSRVRKELKKPEHGLLSISLTTEEVPVYRDEHGQEHMLISPQRSSTSTEYAVEEEEEVGEEEKRRGIEVEKDVLLMEEETVEEETVVLVPPFSASSEEEESVATLEPPEPLIPVMIAPKVVIVESHVGPVDSHEPVAVDSQEPVGTTPVVSSFVPVESHEQSIQKAIVAEEDQTVLNHCALLRTMSTRLTLEELDEVVDDCLPSDSDPDSDVLDGDFNFDSDSD